MDRRLCVIAACGLLLLALAGWPARSGSGVRARLPALRSGRSESVAARAASAWPLRRDCKPQAPLRLECHPRSGARPGEGSLLVTIEPLVPLQGLSWSLVGDGPGAARAPSGGVLASAGLQALVLPLPASGSVAPALRLEGRLAGVAGPGTTVVATLPLADELPVQQPSRPWRDPDTGASLSAALLPTLHREGR